MERNSSNAALLPLVVKNIHVSVEADHRTAPRSLDPADGLCAFAALAPLRQAVRSLELGG